MSMTCHCIACQLGATLCCATTEQAIRKDERLRLIRLANIGIEHGDLERLRTALKDNHRALRDAQLLVHALITLLSDEALEEPAA